MLVDSTICTANTMSTDPAAPPADIDADTLATIESRAFGLFKQVMEEAYKAEQFKAVIQLAHAMLVEADGMARQCEATQKPENMTRALVAEHLASNWAPKVLNGLAEVAKAGGMAAFRKNAH
jgi:hypothetical protein